ncbi:MAG: Lrp/AsnC family transcriptional regulator [Halieaceae bacterium]|nr:Lrp/AsnC family transcriptional regulator [Halieaceae bacterium]
MQELTKSDLKILELLQKDSTLSTAEIAEHIGLSQSPCWRRIQRLEQAGLFEERGIRLNRDLLGLDLVVFVTINLRQTGTQDLLQFEQDIRKHPEIVECYTMTGLWDYMLKIVAKDIKYYESFARNVLMASQSIREMHSHIAVTEIKNTVALPLSQLTG